MWKLNAKKEKVLSLIVKVHSYHMLIIVRWIWSTFSQGKQPDRTTIRLFGGLECAFASGRCRFRRKDMCKRSAMQRQGRYDFVRIQVFPSYPAIGLMIHSLIRQSDHQRLCASQVASSDVHYPWNLSKWTGLWFTQLLAKSMKSEVMIVVVLSCGDSSAVISIDDQVVLEQK
jgi:hypothetical protein